MSASRTEAVVALLNGEASVGDIARRHGVSEDEVREWRALFLSGARVVARDAAPARVRRRRVLMGVMVTLASGLVGAGVAVAQSGSCPQVLPGGLTTFCANNPALASEVNGNFQTAYNWVNGKLGAPTSAANVMPSTLQVNGATGLNAGLTVTGSTSLDGGLSVSGNESFGSQTRQMLNLYGTSYGVGVQASTAYFRSASGFAFFRGGVHSDSQNSAGSGGAVAMTLDSNSSLSVSGALSSRGKTVIKDVSTCCNGNSGCAGGTPCCCPGGMTVTGADLNAGAGGQFCYLCIQRAD